MHAEPISRRAHALPRSRPKYSARPFVLTVGLMLLFAVVSWVVHGNEDRPRSPAARPLSARSLPGEDLECRLVHKAADKCAFIKANCPDEEAGIFSYLTLYYCRLPHAQPVAFTILVIWLGLLFSTIGIAASDFFCPNLSTIANLLGMSESMAGVTFLAIGNGSPDVFSTFAAMSTNSASLAIGELIGAACFITAVVAGSMALVRPFKVARKSFLRDVGFFIVAAGFSMVFLADGKLALWESATMVGFYLFYVCFVVVWHWWLGRRTARRRRAASMRSHYVTPGGEEEEIFPEYHDEDDGPTADGSRTPGARTITGDDFAALERAGGDQGLAEDDNEQVRERWLGEMNNRMRLSRPLLGQRRTTHTPIRPSLVGALEFRAVLTSLQQSRNIQSMPISLRRYSDDPYFTSAQQQNLSSRPSDPAPRPVYDIPQEDSDGTPLVSRPTTHVQRSGSRLRAVSANDMDRIMHNPNALVPVPNIDFAPPSPETERDPPSASGPVPPSPTISLSPPPSEHASRPTSPAPSTQRPPTSDRLAPPALDSQGLHSSRQGSTSPSPLSSPVLPPMESRTRQHPTLVIPSSPPRPFPPYTDEPFSARSSQRVPSLLLPTPSVSPQSYFPDDILLSLDQPKTPRWWPSSVIPAPAVLLSTLFPTLTKWSSRNIWTKLLSIVAAPSVFLLTATLPVVETPREDDSDDGLLSPTLTLPPPLTPTATHDSFKHGSPVPTKMGNAATAGVQLRINDGAPIRQSPDQLSANSLPSETSEWNRWLVLIQAFTAPFFIVLMSWANSELKSPRVLLRRTCYSLIFSLVLLAVLLTTTTPSRPPRWRPLLCFMGFAVSIAWISSIANEVVGVLKTLGVIMDMSDAILGLTIFAVGNSLGDLVANITVARLGLPVMALSACFGGPMLNILLGIGISGCYMIIQGGNKHHRKHPDTPIHFKPYHIDISTTLIISGATLLGTLVFLLVAVPFRGWKMDRQIGWGLMALWVASTIGNVVVEIVGLSSNVS